MSEKINDHVSLFNGCEYQDMFAAKEKYENAETAAKVQETLEWTKTQEYRDLNFARQDLVINPLKACQPSGGLFAAIGFEGTMPFVHGSQGCASYFRSHFMRHFREPFPTSCDAMTEDAAVFGGHNALYLGLQNTYELYSPKMITMVTSCMSEVIGDDMNSFVKNAKEQGFIPADFPVTFAHTPSFVGSHIVGYDNTMLAILQQMGVKKETKNDKINVIMGFDTYLANYEEIKRIFKLFGAEINLLSDPSETLNSPTNGEYKMYRGGTPLDDLRDAPNSKATLLLQKWSMIKTAEFIEKDWGQPVKVVNPLGLEGSDELIMAISELTGKPVPAELELERGQFVDAIADSYYWIHGKTFGINGDPDMAYGLARFVMEMGGEPIHILVSNGSKDWEAETKENLSKYEFAKGAQIWAGKDMWHFRSLLFTEPVDMIIGNSYAKYLERDTGIALCRIGFPLQDRHHLHRYPTIGYKGGVQMLTWIVNRMLDDIDKKTMYTTSYDILR
ncbi:nitrogenase molybdenum-iron protein subunit beta [Seleniivibrio woodruffii]|uniref:Nitrogenase molybdenum-iron protein beta chain n=1 Tax=Seleniivibrio woodruffii TaxID=1078050 RepID=A0A4R1KCJ2_9BACT|nr:nitrogenase molybdenum-iron protein subunit beta [Seleniivibrio woodruffii]TCK62255.1 Mo-nitrogenase MoFe protein subunit NifK [Seleniivibrio woodruffii]TVZ34627.1 Mo-nitrogenase MoFe protein subunit NifK [Seleniivibrio woodruffii]